MKELSIQEKAQLYDEAIERAKKIYDNRTTEEIFPELKESEDEKIKNAILNHLKKMWGNSQDDVRGVHVEDAIDWLEKQRDKDKLIQELGEYKVKYTQEVLEKYINSMSNKDDERLRKTTIAFLKDFAEQGYENAVECIDWLEKQCERKPKDKYTFNSIPRLLDMIEPTSKAKAYCQKLIETLVKEGYITDAKIVSDCLKQMNGEKVAMATMDEQKPADKIEPRFKVGDWIITPKNKVLQITSIEGTSYRFNNESHYWEICYCDEQCRFWTIQDAKDGDVLAAHECYVVFKEIDGLNIKCYCTYHYLGLNPSFYKDTLQNKDAFLPATKEQRDAMMKAMADAGYEWDAEKKELKYKLTAFEDAIKDMMDNYRDAIDEDEATAEEVKNVLTIFNTL